MAEPTSPEAEKNQQAPSGGVRPDDPTPNRDRRREPPTLDLKAHSSEPRPTSPAEPPPQAEAEPPKRESAAKTQAAPRSRTAAWGFLAGAVVAAGVGGAAYWFAGANSEATATLQRQIGDLQTRLAALDRQAKAAATQSGLDDLDKRLAAAEAATKAVSTDLGKRIAGLDQDLASERTAANNAAEALGKRAGDIEQRAHALKAEVDDAATKAEQARLEVAQAVVALAAARTVPGMPVTLPPPVDLSPLEDRVGKLEARLGATEAGLAAAKKELDREAQARAEAVPSVSGTTGAAIAARALVQAFDQGAPYAEELATAAALGANGDRVALLQPFAAKGAPTRQALAAQFDDIAAKVAEKAGAAPSQGLLGGLSGFVQVRPVGGAESSEPSALVADIKSDLAAGKVEEALVAWGKLPAPARDVSQDWAKTAKARTAAAAASQAILTDALAASAKSKS